MMKISWIEPDLLAASAIPIDIAQGLSFEQARDKVKARRPYAAMLSDKQRAFLNDFIEAMKIGAVS